jgi:predicted secreted protein with PEFG-CTERM motif
MKTKAICSFFVLFAIAAVMVSSTPAAFADHAEVTIATSDDSGFNMECGVDCYTPNIATVDVGGVVTFSNPVGFHTFTAGTWEAGMAPAPSGEFDVTLAAAESATWSPTEAGEIPYYCSLHMWMSGTIIVQEAEAEEHDEEAEAAAQAEADAAAQAEADAAAQAEADAAAQAEADAAAEELVVVITDSIVDDGTQVNLEFSTIHVNYEIIAMQNGEEILKEAAHAMEMTGASHMIDAIGSDESPIDIEIVSLGIGPPGANQDWTGPTGTVASAQVVPEFGTIAMMILAVAIISIVAVTAKSRIVPRF